MREHGIKRIYTRDTDFHRFPFPLSLPVALLRYLLPDPALDERYPTFICGRSKDGHSLHGEVKAFRSEQWKTKFISYQIA